MALARTILTKANFMLLDEPTNHLDIQSVNMLIRVLQKFKGSYIIVSHDRFFLAEVANKIWYIENKELKEYPGTYAEYEEWQERNREQVAVNQKKQIPLSEKSSDDQKNKRSSEKENEQKKEYQKLSNKVKYLENKIEDLENKKLTIENTLSDSEIYTDNNKVIKLTQELSDINLSLNDVKTEWEKTFTLMIESEPS